MRLSGLAGECIEFHHLCPAHKCMSGAILIKEPYASRRTGMQA